MSQLTATPTVSEYGFGDAFIRVRQRADEAHLGLAKARVVNAIRQISKRGENWDGCGSPAPSSAACSHAIAEAYGFIQAAFESGLGWIPPLIGSNEYGEVSFEWWRGEKRLTVYVGAEQMHFVCSWGWDINNHMDAGLLPPDGFLHKWRWFRV